MIMQKYNVIENDGKNDIATLTFDSLADAEKYKRNAEKDRGYNYRIEKTLVEYDGLNLNN